MGVGRELGQRIREIRKSHNLTEEQLASRMGMSQSRLSKLENGKLAPTMEFLFSLARELRLSSSEQGSLLALGELILGQFRFWETTDPDSIMNEQRAIRVLERNARSIVSVQDQVVPGLIQTPHYTQALFEVISRGFAQNVKSAMAARSQRRTVLSKKEIEIEFVIWEGALRRAVGSRQIMVEQLDYLLALCRRGMELRVLPSDCELKMVPGGSFDIFDKRVVVIETLVGVLTLTKAEQVSQYTGAFSLLKHAALGQRETESRLRAVREQFVSGPLYAMRGMS